MKGSEGFRRRGLEAIDINPLLILKRRSIAMKKIILLALAIMLVFASTSFAAERYSLGTSNLALKVDYFSFTEDAFDEIDLDEGIYVGLEGYYAIYPDLYLGMEGGWATTENDDDIRGINVDIDVQFIPIELNLKYAFEFAPQWVASVGAGVSYSYFEIEADGIDEDADDWVFGGQAFAGIDYNFNDRWFFGIEGKYQVTDDLEFDDVGRAEVDVDTETSADNWRVGAKVGFIF
jgi:opacity protein-like surface antigen